MVKGHISFGYDPNYFHLTKPIFKYEQYFDESSPYMKFGRNQCKMTKLESPQMQTDGHFGGHFSYSTSDKTHIQSWASV